MASARSAGTWPCWSSTGRLLVIDCGVLFPEAEQPGVDLILPDFGVIEHRLDDIDAVVLTHGHEDHIGADPVPAAAA